MKRKRIFEICIIAIFGVIGFVLNLLEFGIPAVIPDFIKLHFSDLPALIIAFVINPIAGVLTCFVTHLLHIPLTYSGGIGEFANFLLGSVFVLIAGFIYRRKRSYGYAVAGCITGALVMAAVSLPVNYYITYPVYMEIMPVEAILNAYNKIWSGSEPLTLFKSILFFNVPFNAVKGLIVSFVTVVSFKRIRKAFDSILNRMS